MRRFQGLNDLNIALKMIHKSRGREIRDVFDIQLRARLTPCNYWLPRCIR